MTLDVEWDAPDWTERAVPLLAPAEPKVRRWDTPGAMARYLDPTTNQTPLLDLVDDATVRVLDGATRKQILAAPPQTGKSQRVSRRLPLWALTCDPTLRIAIVSADLGLARRWGLTIKRDIEEHPELGVTLRADSKSAARWETEQGGSLFCTGWSSGTIGQPIDLLIIDDLITTRQRAESATTREAIWDFWENDASTRARRTILMATRWHVDDLSGRLQEREPGQWDVLAVPAISEGEGDPLGRAEGAEIESANPALHPPGYFYDKQKTTSSYVWNSIYQQHPTAAAGNLFKRGDWQAWTFGGTDATGRAMIVTNGHPWSLADCSRFITIDLATSVKTSADYTVAAAWAISPGGDVLCLDRKRERVPEIDHAAFVKPLRDRWLGSYDVVHVESRMFGTTLVYAMGQAGVPIAELKADTDKISRAQNAASLVRQKRVYLPAKAEWWDEWVDEHADFPNVSHDDQVDVMAYAARVAVVNWLPPLDAAVEQAYAARKSPDDIPDPMAFKW